MWLKHKAVSLPLRSGIQHPAAVCLSELSARPRVHSLPPAPHSLPLQAAAWWCRPPVSALWTWSQEKEGCWVQGTRLIHLSGLRRSLTRQQNWRTHEPVMQEQNEPDTYIFVCVEIAIIETIYNDSSCTHECNWICAPRYTYIITWGQLILVSMYSTSCVLKYCQKLKTACLHLSLVIAPFSKSWCLILE